MPPRVYNIMAEWAESLVMTYLREEKTELMRRFANMPDKENTSSHDMGHSDRSLRSTSGHSQVLLTETGKVPIPREEMGTPWMYNHLLRLHRLVDEALMMRGQVPMQTVVDAVNVMMITPISVAVKRNTNRNFVRNTFGQNLIQVTTQILTVLKGAGRRAEAVARGRRIRRGRAGGVFTTQMTTLHPVRSP